MKEGIRHTADTKTHGVWVPAFAGTTKLCDIEAGAPASQPSPHFKCLAKNSRLRGQAMSALALS